MTYSAHRAPRTERIAWITLAAVVAALILAAALFYLVGGRWFVIQTPSMGEYAPVGTLVLSSVAGLTNLHKGTMILFHPPTDPGVTYFHRIYSISGGAIHTKGDINPNPDPWTLHSGDLIGTEFAHFAGFGWLVEALPILLVGGLILYVITHYYVNRYWRFPVRVFGWALLLALAAWMLKPFIRAVLLVQTVVHGQATSRIVSTGLFDLNAHAVGGSSTVLRAGQVGTVASSHLAKTGQYLVDLSPGIGFGTWFVLVLIWLIPLALCVVYALRRPEPVFVYPAREPEPASEPWHPEVFAYPTE